MRAASQFKHVRIDLMECEDPADHSKRILVFKCYVKPASSEWHHRQILWREERRGREPLMTMSDVYENLGDLLGAAAFPRIEPD